jgi:hypothetical protein
VSLTPSQNRHTTNPHALRHSRTLLTHALCRSVAVPPLTRHPRPDTARAQAPCTQGLSKRQTSTQCHGQTCCRRSSITSTAIISVSRAILRLSLSLSEPAAMRSVALLSRVLWSLERVSSPRKPPPLCDPPASSSVRSEASWRCSPHEYESTHCQAVTHLSDACLHMQGCGQGFRLRLSELSIPAAGSGDMYCLSRMFCVSLMNAAGILTLHTCPAVFDARARHLRVHARRKTDNVFQGYGSGWL